MVDFLEILAHNAETFFQNLPETKGAHIYVRPERDVPKFFPGDPVMKKAISITIGVDFPETQESRVLAKKEHIMQEDEQYPPEMIVSFLAQSLISDMFQFALGQTLMMYRRAELEGKVLVDKPVEAPAAV
jgi:hypothetical protein